MYIFLLVVSCLYSTIIASEDTWERIGGIFELDTHKDPNSFATSMLCVDGSTRDTFKLMTEKRSILIAVASAINSSQKSIHISACKPLEGELTLDQLESSKQFRMLREWLGGIDRGTVKKMYILLPADVSKKRSAWRQKKDPKARLWESEMKKVIDDFEVFPYTEDENGINNIEIKVVPHCAIVAFKDDRDGIEGSRWEDRIPFPEKEVQ